MNGWLPVDGRIDVSEPAVEEAQEFPGLVEGGRARRTGAADVLEPAMIPSTEREPAAGVTTPPWP
jgi:hypothetical protein